MATRLRVNSTTEPLPEFDCFVWTLPSLTIHPGVRWPEMLSRKQSELIKKWIIIQWFEHAIQRTLIGNKTVTLRNTAVDKFNRTLAYVFTPDETNVNVKMCEDGWDRWYPFQDGCKSYEQHDKVAQKKNLTTWSDKNYTLPWVWRHNRPK